MNKDRCPIITPMGRCDRGNRHPPPCSIDGRAVPTTAPTAIMRAANALRDPEEWNARHPVGTIVRYFPVRGDFDHIDTRTRSNAWIASGQALVKVDGVAGGVSLEHLVVVDP